MLKKTNWTQLALLLPSSSTARMRFPSHHSIVTARRYFQSSPCLQATTAANSHSSMLNSLPEYQQGLLFQQKGQFQQAFTSFERVYEVLNHAFGDDHPLANEIFFRLAALRCYQGQREKAVEMMETQSFQHLPDQLSRQIFLANTYLCSYHNVMKSQEMAEKAVELVENQNHANPDNTLFSAAYSSLGLAALYGNNLQDAETYLLLASRWATTPLEEVKAFVNNGALIFFKLANGIDCSQSYHYWQKEEEDCQRDHRQLHPDEVHKSPLTFLATTGKNEADGHNLILSATGCWNEALQLVEKEKLDITKDEELAIALATLYINYGSLMGLLGKTQESNDYLAKAVQALKPFDESLTIQPTLGVALRKIGLLHMKTTQAVTAEGLFNASLGKFAIPLVKFDARYNYEAAVTRACYGQLLMKWDKRELKGKEMLEEAKKAFDSLPRLNGGLRLSTFTLFPKPY